MTKGEEEFSGKRGRDIPDAWGSSKGGTMQSDMCPHSAWTIDLADNTSAAARPANQSGSLSRPAHRNPVRGGGLRRRPTRIMRDIIKALKASVQDLAREECEATGGKCDPCFYPTYDRPNNCDTALSRHGPAKPRDYTARRPDDGSTASRTNNTLLVASMGTIKLLRSEDLCSEQQVYTELTCDYCNCTFLLQDGGASFDGKAACTHCEQKLNQDVVLPAVNQTRSQMRQTPKLPAAS